MQKFKLIFLIEPGISLSLVIEMDRPRWFRYAECKYTTDWVKC